MIKNHRKDLLDNPAWKGAPDYNQTLYSTWSLSFAILRERARQNPSTSNSREHIAIQLLNIFAVFHHNGIMEDTFRRAAERRHLEQTPANHSEANKLSFTTEFLPLQMLEVDSDGDWDRFVFREGICVLRSFSLIHRGKEHGTYSAHPLAHCWSRERLNQAKQNQTCQSVHAILSSSIAIGQPGHNTQYCRQLLPHINSLQRYSAEMGVPEKCYDDAFVKYWHVYFENGYIKEAEQFATKVYESRMHVLGEKHRYTLTATANLAITLRESGENGALQRAKALHEKAHNLRVELLGREHVETLDSKYELGSIYTHNNEFNRAEDFLNHALEGRKTQLREQLLDTIKTESLLSGVYRSLGRYQEAEILQQKTLDKATKVLSETDPDTIMAMANLAATLTVIEGKVSEAEELKLRIVDLRKRVFGENNPETLMAQANLASTYCQQKRWEDTEVLLLPVIEKRMLVLGTLHRETLGARLILVNCYIGHGRLGEAEDQCTRVANGRTEILRERHSHTLWSMHKLACVYHAQGRLDKAVALWENPLAIQEQTEVRIIGKPRKPCIILHAPYIVNPGQRKQRV
jgi:tetratricopeptide (TPR) repeat protein